MREILFRGKRADNGEWIEGFFAKEEKKSYIVRNKHKTGVLFFVDEVDPETVGQYTGLTDENGTKIFEGDIVKCHDCLLRSDQPFHEFIGYVDFADGSFVIRSDCFSHYRWVDYEVEVIGNIHDDKEILNDSTV